MYLLRTTHKRRRARRFEYVHYLALTTLLWKYYMFTKTSTQHFIKKNTLFWFEMHSFWQTVKSSNFLWMLMIIKQIKFSLFPSPEFKLFVYYNLSLRTSVQKDRNLSKKLLFINKAGHPRTITKRNISFSSHTFLPKKCTEWQNQS